MVAQDEWKGMLRNISEAPLLVSGCFLLAQRGSLVSVFQFLLPYLHSLLCCMLPLLFAAMEAAGPGKVKVY